MLTSCSDTDLEQLYHEILETSLSQQSSSQWTSQQRSLILKIANLKRFLVTDGCKLVKWSFSVLLAKSSTDDETLKDPVIKHILDFLTSCISFLEMINKSTLGALFEMTKENILQARERTVYAFCLVADNLPQFFIPKLHRYLMTQLADIGNPITLAINNSNNMDEDDLGTVIILGHDLWEHLLNKHITLVRESVMDLLDSYLRIVNNSSPVQLNDGMKSNMDQGSSHDWERYILGYIMAIPLISSQLTNECWSAVFNKLYHNNTISNLILFENQTGYSLLRRTSKDEFTNISSIFGLWLSNVAFVPQQVIMKHAFDVAIMLDTVVYDPRLHLQHLAPSDGNSTLDNFLPSLDKSDISSSSIDLVDDWVVPILDPIRCQQRQYDQPRQPHQLKIPIFFLQFTILNNNTLENAVDLCIKLMTLLPIASMDHSETKMSTNRHLLRNVTGTAENKWPDFFRIMLEQLFSKAMAFSITGDDKDSTKVENIFGNLAIIFDDLHNNDVDSSTPEVTPSTGFQIFASYIASHWRQVMLLFMSHPSRVCRAMGYRVMINSKFWLQEDQLQPSDPPAIAKALVESWFTQLKSRYSMVVENDEDRLGDSNGTLDICLLELQQLMSQCCLREPIAAILISTILESVLNGELETFPRSDASSWSSSTATSFLDRIVNSRHTTNSKYGSYTLDIPRYIPTIEVLKSDWKTKDKIYMSNIDHTANILRQTSSEAVARQLMISINGKLPTLSTVSQDIYDDALPYKIPYATDITNGNAFKDHPILFLMLDQCFEVDQNSCKALLRSVFIYFVTFWNLQEVANKPMSLYFATQLQETIYLLSRMEMMIPTNLSHIGELLPYLSSHDIGVILHKVIWPCIRHFYDPSTVAIPGFTSSSSHQVLSTSSSSSTDPQLVNQCMEQLKKIYQQRKLVFSESQDWTTALETVGNRLGIDQQINNSDDADL